MSLEDDLARPQEHIVATVLESLVNSRQNEPARRGTVPPSRMLRVNAQLIGEKSCPDIKTCCFIDCGSAFNVISPLLAKKLELPIHPIQDAVARYLNGSPVKIYGHAAAKMTITDTFGKSRGGIVPLTVMDSAQDDVVLGMPWLETWNPSVNFAVQSMKFRRHSGRKYRKIAIEGLKDFVKSTTPDDANQLFLCRIDAILPSTSIEPPKEYHSLRDVFLEEKSTELPEHGPQDLAIDLIEGQMPPFGPLYNLSEAELATLRVYLEKYLKRGWIRHSKSPAGAPILFVKKKDGTLRLCVDYRGLNSITVKNRHPLPLIAESLDRLARAKRYTTVDIGEAYHRLRIRQGDEWKTAFRTRYGHFEYTVIPFGLTNAPAAFQAYINQALVGLIDVICIVYLDDVLIFSEDPDEHVNHVRQVLERLRDHKLYVKLSKSTFHATDVEYLGFRISPKGVFIDPERVQAIQEWPEPRTVREIRIFIGFINYYRRFVKHFSRLAAPLNLLTKKLPNEARKGQKMRNEESVPIELGDKARQSFQDLKNMFLESPILVHFDPSCPTKVETDASGRAISGILSQDISQNGGKPDWRPVAFFSRKLSDTETRYDTHDSELLAIVATLRHWRRYLAGLETGFVLLTDHSNLQWFMTTKSLTRRQARWTEHLAEFDFHIVHRPGRTNPADGPSRRPDYMENASNDVDRATSAVLGELRAKLALAKDKFSSVSIMAAITRAMTQSSAVSGTIVPPVEVVRSGTDGDLASHIVSSDLNVASSPNFTHSKSTGNSEPNQRESDQPNLDLDADPMELDPVLPNPTTPMPADSSKARILVTRKEDQTRILYDCHNSALSGHFGVRRTLEKIQRRYTWPNLRRDVKEYVDACVTCGRNVTRRHAPYGLLQPLEVPNGPWTDITIDFVTDLPPSRFGDQVYDALMVVVDRFSKMAHYVPVWKDIDAKELARIFLREVFRHHGAPETIVSDRGPFLVAKYWRTFTHFISSTTKLSTAFHPQTDGQTEQQNQTLEHYL